MMMLTAETGFAAAHQIKNYPGPCQNLHGHNYKLFVTVAGEPDPETGMVIDFVKMKEIIKARVLDLCDHRYLNEFIPLPSSENIILWIWGRLEGHLAGLYELKLYEVEDSYIVYRGKSQR
jgi:6-pyruvoyltetrahydropterin/6-carboxytetrahydropterin synthase